MTFTGLCPPCTQNQFLPDIRLSFPSSFHFSSPRHCPRRLHPYLQTDIGWGKPGLCEQEAFHPFNMHFTHLSIRTSSPPQQFSMDPPFLEATDLPYPLCSLESMTSYCCPPNFPLPHCPIPRSLQPLDSNSFALKHMIEYKLRIELTSYCFHAPRVTSPDSI